MALSREELLCVLLATDSVYPKIQQERRTNVHAINKSRSAEGEYYTLFPKLRAHSEKFYEYFRMDEETFNYILRKIESRITKKWCNLHQTPILPEERLMITLRYLSTGVSFRALAFSFRMGKSTVTEIIKETVEALWDELQPLHMPVPTTELLRNNATEFHNIWNFPHAVGCLDGKHIRLICPANSGSMYYNYKNYFSVVLQALVDARYKFIAIDVGGYGKQSDGGTYLASDLYNFINQQIIKFPEPEMLPHSRIKAPFAILADEAYPLLPNLMKPYQREGLTEMKRRFNDRLSRARKTVECAFGITYSKWRILSKSIETSVELADKIVKCVCVLHNTIIDKEGFERHLTDVNIVGQNVSWERRGRPPTEAKNIRATFAQYFEKYPLHYK